MKICSAQNHHKKAIWHKRATSSFKVDNAESSKLWHWNAKLWRFLRLWYLQFWQRMQYRGVSTRNRFFEITGKSSSKWFISTNYVCSTSWHESSQVIILSSSRFCENLSLEHKFAEARFLFVLSYLVLYENDSIKKTTNPHLFCSRQVSSELTNSYSNVFIAFHITFYEKIEAESPLNNYVKWKQQEIWKIDYLYEKLKASNKTNRLFRQSAFIVCLCLLRQLINAYIEQTLTTSKRLKEASASNQQKAFE